MRALRKFAALSVFAASLAGLAGAGCGGVHYATTVNTAASRLEEARENGAEQLAPYEYYYAKAHLEEAQVEASEANYSDGAAFAETAEEYAQKAIELSQAARRAAAGHL